MGFLQYNARCCCGGETREQQKIAEMLLVILE
jgi:hypothetical protein